MKAKILYCCAAMALLTVARVNGATFFADQFNYANGDLTVVNGAGNNVSGGAWVPFSGQTFTAESINVVSGQAELLISGSEDASRKTGSPLIEMAAGQTWYYGAIVTVNDQRATPATTAIVNEYFLLMKDNTTGGLRSRMYVNNPATGTGGAGFRFGIGPSSGAANAANWGTDLAFGTKYKVVASYAFDTGAVSMWVNPVTSGSTNVSSSAGAGPGTFISELGLRQAFNSGGVTGGPSVPNTQILIDAVSFGDSFNDVLAALVPEPTGATMALAGLLGLTATRRSRRR